MNAMNARSASGPPSPSSPRPPTSSCGVRQAWGSPTSRWRWACGRSPRGHPAGHGVYFVRAHDLLEDLRRAHAEHRLDRRLRVYPAPKVLVIDEFGVWPCDRLAATAFFALLSARDEKSSVILTCNKSLADWAQA